VPGAFFNPLGAALLDSYSKLLPDYRFEIVPSGGALTNLQVLQRGGADLGFAFADVTYLAYVGRLEEEPVPFDQLRGVAILQLTAVHLLVRVGPGIQSIDQLRGRAVALGPQGSGTASTAKVLLEAFGVPVASMRAEHLPFVEAANRLAGGGLDAAFVSAGYPAESVAEATQAGAELLAVSGPVVDQLRTDYPFLKGALIPAGTYPRVDRPVHTVGIDTLIACRAGLDETLVYTLTKTFFDVLPQLAVRLDALRRMDLARAPATPIPLHDGAARFYRERELFR
jgi:TRAP transporter TAXI family solute receptor